MFIAIGATRFFVERQWARSEVPSNSANSAGAIRKFSAMVTAEATAMASTKKQRRRGSMAWKAAATSIAGVDEPAMLITSARQR